MTRLACPNPNPDDVRQPGGPAANVQAFAFDFITPDGQVVAFAAAQAALQNHTAVLIGGFLVGYSL